MHYVYMTHVYFLFTGLQGGEWKGSVGGKKVFCAVSTEYYAR